MLSNILPTALVSRLVDRKSTRLNSSHPSISYAVFCLKKNMIDAGGQLVVGRGCGVVEGAVCAVAEEGVARAQVDLLQLFVLVAVDRVQVFFFNDPGPPEIYTLSLPDPLPI